MEFRLVNPVPVRMMRNTLSHLLALTAINLLLCALLERGRCPAGGEEEVRGGNRDPSSTQVLWAWQPVREAMCVQKGRVSGPQRCTSLVQTRSFGSPLLLTAVLPKSKQLLYFVPQATGSAAAPWTPEGPCGHLAAGPCFPGEEVVNMRLPQCRVSFTTVPKHTPGRGAPQSGSHFPRGQATPPLAPFLQ
ncbi:hypothetical protein NDU88_004325 [Pleurodeles waltl]|uniref:Uncharacterized protein n=1 Tax=Pleurodeles waltl TaxID=8319 RepID=A0AAV7PCM2_PLEWA|nr:hypothetical protein NDU88_004325 [Pleurodeles waltl]